VLEKGSGLRALRTRRAEVASKDYATGNFPILSTYLLPLNMGQVN
jgi:hypothetical protein